MYEYSARVVMGAGTRGLLSEPIGQTTMTTLIRLVLASYPERKWDNRKNGKRESYRIGFPRPAAARFPYLS